MVDRCNDAVAKEFEVDVGQDNSRIYELTITSATAATARTGTGVGGGSKEVAAAAAPHACLLHYYFVCVANICLGL